ncbi:MAG: cell division protein FtsW [Chlamydiia bacterium]|nr:cell division protein FtsW [Chlamydiia bacterium]
MRVLILVCFGLIFALGLMMVFNTSSAFILDRFLDTSLHHALIRQMLYAVIGLICGFVVLRVGADNLIRLGIPLFVLTLFLLLLVYVPGVGHMRNGARRWVGVGGFSFQPSEFAKFVLPLTFLALFFQQAERKVNFASFCWLVGLLFIPIFFVMLEPDHGTAFVMGLSLMPLFFLSGVKWQYWVIPVLCLTIVGGVLAYQVPYVRARVKVYLHPELDLLGKGHQPYQAKIAAGSGGLLGKGPGGSLQKLTYLPEAQNDYIAAIFAEEFGFVGILVLLFLYMLFTFAGFSIAFASSNRLGCYLATALTFVIGIQAFLNLAVVAGMLPSKGVNLPFFSQGGSSLVANICMLACLISIGGKKETVQWQKRFSSP